MRQKFKLVITNSPSVSTDIKQWKDEESQICMVVVLMKTLYINIKSEIEFHGLLLILEWHIN